MTCSATHIGEEMHRWIGELFPICRSITGNGARETLRLIQKRIPLTICEVSSGTKVFDWTVPLEWNIQDAYIKDRTGRRVVDFKKSNLHVVSYSQPVKQRMTLAELKPHLHTLPEHPDWVPYRTSYYKESWGFCLPHNVLLSLKDEEYDVCIDASLHAGHLSYGEWYLPGATEEEVLVSTHTCHPSMVNDNLSGISVATFLAEWLRARPSRRYSYRFVFVPGTIGPITWLSQNQATVARIRHGLVLTGLGDSGIFNYKKSRRGDAVIDRAMRHVLTHAEERFNVIEFFPYGYDERQYCSPGFNLPIGCFMRTPHSQYPEYHTSADNLDFVRPESLARSLAHCESVIDILEHDRTYRNQSPFGEPQLGKRGLYRAVGGQAGEKSREMALLWVLNLSDGHNSLLDIAERANISFDRIHEAADVLVKSGLLEEHRRPDNT